MSMIQRIMADKRVEVTRLPKKIEAPKSFQPENAAEAFLNALSAQPTGKPNLIMEIKRSSPFDGPLMVNPLAWVLNHYNKMAKAISVVTDQKRFDGSFMLLSEVRLQTPLPILCKDFVLDTRQVDLACNAGANAVLLIAKVLDPQQLSTLGQYCQRKNVCPVFEVQTEEELKKVLPLNPKVIMINNRNLDTGALDLSTTAKLAPLIPKGIKVISASGVHNPTHVKQLLPYTDNILVGGALMTTKADKLDSLMSVLSRPV